MKITLILMFLLCLVLFSGFADEEPAELGEFAELEEVAEFGEFEDQYVGGGGPMPTLLFLDFEDLNGAITDAGYPQISQVLFANGGGGYGGALDGLRIGGFYIGGDTMSASESRSVSLNMGYGGMMIEKAVRSDDDFTVVLGTMLGFGSLDLRFISNLPETFEDAVANPFLSSMSKEFYVVQPYVAFESKPYSWMWARFQLGFLWTLADKWTFEETEFAGPPRTFGGLTASLMIRFGGSGLFPLDEMETALDELVEEPDAPDDSESDSEPSQVKEVEEAKEAETE
ncbi:hypothetical protein KAT84_00530 [Candidatus Bipolaricaulota bacterium]|jgi:hypothetical protein|nr:hypothetical protein [Candidatus Bipolaricaulota bacterium]